MKLEDVDFQFQHEFATITLSEFSNQDIDQIEKIAEAIQMEKIFENKTIAIIAAFNLYLQSLAATNDHISKGGFHH